jgi:hypothetical protein
MEAKTIQERIRMTGRQRLPWPGMDIDGMERACAIIDAVAAEFGDARAYNPATHVVVSKSLAHHAMLTCLETAEKIDCKDCVAAAHELRAALEGGR